MKLQIPYNELEAYIQQKYNQQIALKYVDEKTVSVSKTVKVIVSKTVTANVSVAQLVGNDIFLTYHAGFALDLVAKGATAWFKDSLNGIVEEAEADNTLKVHLDAVPQLQNLLDNIQLNGITFDTDGVNILFSLK